MNMITDRYASAVNSRSLTVEPRTRMSDTDVLGAYGLASRVTPLGVALERFFAGDGREAANIVTELSQAAHRHSFKLDCRISRVECDDMAKACLAWHRNGTCRACGGHGYLISPGTPTLSERECPACNNTGRRPLEQEFGLEHRELARWMVAELARETGRAGPEAMRALAPKLEL